MKRFVVCFGFGVGFSWSWSWNPGPQPCSTSVGSPSSVPCLCFSEMELAPELQMSFSMVAQSGAAGRCWPPCQRGRLLERVPGGKRSDPSWTRTNPRPRQVCRPGGREQEAGFVLRGSCGGTSPCAELHRVPVAGTVIALDLTILHRAKGRTRDSIVTLISSSVARRPVTWATLCFLETRSICRHIL